jgi:hypothetical protein
MDFVVNEWLPAYFRPEATAEQKQQLESFLQQCYAKRDVIVVRRPSPFLSKIYRYASDYQTNQKVYTNLNGFIKFVLLDSSRVRFVDDPQPALPPATHERLYQEGTNYQSDAYLFEAAMHSESKIIITTDARLVSQMQDDPIFKVVLLAGFLETY